MNNFNMIVENLESKKEKSLLKMGSFIVMGIIAFQSAFMFLSPEKQTEYILDPAKVEKIHKEESLEVSFFKSDIKLEIFSKQNQDEIIENIINKIHEKNDLNNSKIIFEKQFNDSLKSVELKTLEKVNGGYNFVKSNQSNEKVYKEKQIEEIARQGNFVSKFINHYKKYNKDELKTIFRELMNNNGYNFVTMKHENELKSFNGYETNAFQSSPRDLMIVATWLNPNINLKNKTPYAITHEYSMLGISNDRMPFPKMTIFKIKTNAVILNKIAQIREDSKEHNTSEIGIKNAK